MTRSLIYSEIEINELTDDDLGKPLLYVDKFDNQIGILVGYTNEYLNVRFGSNKEPLLMGPKNFKKISLE